MLITANPVELDKEIARRSLYGFVKIAWPLVEVTPFVDSHQIRVVCRKLERVSNGEIRRLVINLPPGMTKSTLLGVLWPAWDWLTKPWRRWFYGSYDSSLLNGQSGKLIRLVNSEWFVRRWGRVIEGNNPAVSEFKTLKGGSRFNTSFGGKAIGRHAHIQVFDDPIKPKDLLGRVTTYVDPAILDHVWELIAQTFASRAVDPATFARVIVMQRLHPKDPSGRAIEAGWQSLRLPMLFEAEAPDPDDWRTQEGEPLSPNRVSLEACLELKAELDRVDPSLWETQYQQRPQGRAGLVIKPEWILDAAISFDEARALGLGRQLQSWDLTFKGLETSDNVSGAPWLQKDVDDEMHYFVRDEPVFERMTFLQTLESIEARLTIPSWQCGEALVEAKANGPAVMSMLERKWGGLFVPFEPMGSKGERLQACAFLFAARRVHYIKGPSLTRYKDTMTGFPNVRWDDEVDMTTQLLLHCEKGGSYYSELSAIKKRLESGR